MPLEPGGRGAEGTSYGLVRSGQSECRFLAKGNRSRGIAGHCLGRSLLEDRPHLPTSGRESEQLPGPCGTPCGHPDVAAADSAPNAAGDCGHYRKTGGLPTFSRFLSSWTVYFWGLDNFSGKQEVWFLSLGHPLVLK